MSNEPNPPPRFSWLQWYGDGEPQDGDPAKGEEISWCHEPVFKHDVKYIRADLARTDEADYDKIEALSEQLNSARSQLKQIFEEYDWEWTNALDELHLGDLIEKHLGANVETLFDIIRDER